MRFEEQRELMVQEQIISRGITDEKVLDAMRKVERHLFVPEHSRYNAYQDFPIPIGEGQTISQPYIIALMIELLELKSSDKVLEIGTGSGYQTALLAEMADTVCSIERIASLARKARDLLNKLNYENIYIKVSDGTKGWGNTYPSIKEFDAIIISAAAPKIPEKLVEQLANNGRMILPYGNRFSQILTRLTKRGNDIDREEFGGCIFVPLIGKYGWTY